MFGAQIDWSLDRDIHVANLLLKRIEANLLIEKYGILQVVKGLGSST